MRFSFASARPFRAFVTDLDTIRLVPVSGGQAGPRPEARCVSRRLSRPGIFDIDGCSPRARGQDPVYGDSAENMYAQSTRVGTEWPSPNV